MSTKKAPPAGAPFVLPQLGDTGQEQCKSEPFVKNKGRVSSWRWYPAFFASGMVFRLMVWYTRLNKSEFGEVIYMKKSASRIVGLVMLIIAVAFIMFAVNHPEMSFPWNNTITWLLYGLYVLVTVVLLIAPKMKK